MEFPGGSDLSTVQETWVRSLGQEDPLEKEIAAHSSTLAWKIPWTEEPGRLQSMGLQRVGHDLSTEQQQYNVVYVTLVYFICYKIATAIYIRLVTICQHTKF